MEVSLQNFLEQIEVIRARKPQYKLGHCGDDGWCDCIGLIIGALKRCGCTWKQATNENAIHGSNWAARYALDRRFPTGITTESELSVGDIIFKYRLPSDSGYALPGKYREGKTYDVGVYLDFMHVGVVTSVNPLRITHCTAGGVKIDTALGKWRAYGKLRVIVDGPVAKQPVTPAPEAPKKETAAPAPVVKPTTTPSTVRYGSRGSVVEMAQRLLNEHGSKLVVDGDFGARTENATRAYQKKCGLSVDGIIGPKTWAALMD